MVVVGFSGGNGRQQGGGKVAGEKRQGHRCNNQIEVTAAVVAAATLNGSDGHGRVADSTTRGKGVASRLDLYRTNVLMYRTMVLLAHPTKGQTLDE
jgi:hypothetical protein